MSINNYIENEIKNGYINIDLKVIRVKGGLSMEHKQEISEITQILQEIKEKAPQKYEQIKKRGNN